MKRRLPVYVSMAMLVLCAATGVTVLAAEVPPDLTKGETKGVDRERTYNLGATGLRGWIYTKPANFFDSCQGRTTTISRQILVTHVGAKSPADGVMEVGYVILGAGGKPFDDDARKSMAYAIQEAEKAENNGVLKLKVWRVGDLSEAERNALLSEAVQEAAQSDLNGGKLPDLTKGKDLDDQGKLDLLRKNLWRAGKTMDVQLKLRVMGSYSDTAPYNCTKSKRIFEEACKVLAAEPLKEDLWGAINGLALMATGNPEYMPKVREFARKMGPTTLKLKLENGSAWDWGYRGLFLSEYYLLTGDNDVLDAVRQYTVLLAMGQGMYGTFGHGLADRTPDGRLHGSIPPYGPVNAAGLIANLAIVMGSKCGIHNPEVAPAVERASQFFGYFVDKGAIPYGEHEPWPYHENNGKNAMTAVFFAVQGNRIPEARFFAKMVTASYRNREYGHTGQGFSYLWGALGANAGGSAAAAAFFKEASWHFDLVRRCDGSFTYDGGEQYGAGKTDDNTYYGNSSYCGLSPTACYVLAYSLPLKKLYITGKGASQADWLSKKDVAEAIASGRFDLDRKTKTPAELITAFDDWSPIVRGWAAEELASRPESKDLVGQLIALAQGPDAHRRQAAAEALGYIKSTESIPVLTDLLTDKDRWVRTKAATALKEMRDTAKPALPAMLKAVAETAGPLQPVAWDDPVEISNGKLAEVLFGGLLRDSVKGVDPKLLYPAIRAVARNPDGMARMRLRHTFEKLLTVDDVVALAPDILAAIKTRCPADTMFGNEIRMGGFKALTKYHFKEGIEAGVIFAKTQGGHGSESRTGEIMKEIASYGSAAREAVPALRELIAEFNAQCKRGEFPAGELNNRRVSAVEEAIKAIEAATTQPELRSISSARPGAA
jgi:hypothetical protein